MSEDRRQQPNSGRLDTGTTETQRLPPYSAPGREPADQVAAQRSSPSDGVDIQDVSSVASADIVTDIPPGYEPRTSPNRDQDAGSHYDQDSTRTAGDDGDMETTFSKIGDVNMPASVPGDPPPPSIGPLSVPMALLLALIVIAIVVYLVVALI